jgi:AraC-like DNA-binding protein
LSESGEIDSAFNLLNISLQICKRYNNHLCIVSNSIASLYQKIKQYDSAYYYYKLSLKESRENNLVQYEVQGLSDLGKLFFETNETDSALFYINLSNILAKKNNFLRIMAENQLILSKVEELKGNTGAAFKYYKEYADLRDSVFNASIFGDINQLQRMYEVSKTNQQIEELVIKQQIRERTIFIILCILILVSIGLLYIYLQNKKLNKAYKILFEKNLEIINLQEKNESDKSKDSVHNIQYELFKKILLMMEDSALICDTGFSIDKLASMVQSNRTYVSQVVNNVTNKNFRSFLNTYRIREAQRIFSGPDISKYTIESVALMVGFKSRSSFYNVFKDITGVSPNFYLKSMQKQHET